MGSASGRLVDDDVSIGELLRRTKTIAVLGIKTEAQADQPAFYVAEYAQRRGFSIVPVPVYYPEVESILGVPVVRSVAAIAGRVDLANVFRRPKDIPAHLDDLLAARPRAVWFQLGIRHDEAARILTDAGIDVVQDRCLLVEIRRHSARAD
jgi:uncharacterized protein